MSEPPEGAPDSPPHSPPHSPTMDDADIAPRPRPGFRSRPAPPAYDKARLFAGCLRALIGCVGFFASLLYLPVNMATPILSGVSLLMMVTGTTSVWRAVAEVPSLKILTRIAMVLCALSVIATVALTMTLGAGALGPLHDLQQQQRERPNDGSVRFDMGP